MPKKKYRGTAEQNHAEAQAAYMVRLKAGTATNKGAKYKVAKKNLKARDCCKRHKKDAEQKVS